ncbi:hypothetical protein BDZ85DRAFT_286911 [Elsinoe ampelina]|uniref:Short-chain dehydrogenase n=1 Tax=Elsinoe ampelina TaxID=302913 RepID=A0A6A6GPG6_9PEZI|nr:hypothetical protein BDZ85DRAFT_286911 [Elsinoe ampelina]
MGRLLPAMRPTYRDLTGKTAIVTGGNSGIGYGFALQLAEMGATVILACRNEKKATEARDLMLEACPSAKVETLSLDTASLGSVKRFAQNWIHGPIDILAHNAGVSLVPDGKEMTEDGYEYEYQVNFLSSFLLTHLLERHFSKDARVIFTSSIGSYFGGIPHAFEVARVRGKIERGFHTAPHDPGNTAKYSQTKIMQVAFAKALQLHFDSQSDCDRLAFSFEPGLVKSNLLQDLSTAPFDPPSWLLGMLQPLLGLDVQQGSATGVRLATCDQPEVVLNKGRYFDRMWRRCHAVDAYSRNKLDRLWARWSADCDISWYN